MLLPGAWPAAPNGMPASITSGAGDELVVTRLSRMARSVRHLTGIAAFLAEPGIGLVVLTQGIDTATVARHRTYPRVWSSEPATTPTGSNAPPTTAPATLDPPRSAWSTTASSHPQHDQFRLSGIAPSQLHDYPGQLPIFTGSVSAMPSVYFNARQLQNCCLR